MIKRITPSHALFFSLLSATVVAQSRSQPVASPNPTLHTWDPSFAPVAVALLFAFLFVGCFSIYLRRYSDIDLPAGGPTGTIANCSSRGTQGIDPKLLDTFHILMYSTDKRGKDALECAVCLSEFNHHDTLRLLPKCKHVFHTECIDAWLASHVTCPVCRAGLNPAEEHHRGENEVVIVIPNEVNAYREFDESSASRIELNLGERRLGRCHSTGHSLDLDEIGGKEPERYTLRLSEDVRKQILVNHGGMRRSASYDVFRGQPGEESSR